MQHSPVVIIDDATFMDQTAGRVTIVDFWAPWCGPCRAFRPIFENTAVEYTGRVTFGMCDVDTNPQTAELLQIRSIPTVVVFGEGGSELGRFAGALSRHYLCAFVDQFAPMARTR